ncbi:RND family efflux transporter, MFP subunit [Desulfosporosinus acidiphilus SJ4]|uniref:RND family efflux transporter, MFP subunit n=1 Tax=Desulfosporosinus acidiphilus (strain DSM 22704 / JCM 16185 / SJ4) TaxID=646529 RepID=I4D904_DESAJ|nr:efflux RND transporter periplasmic adaptor subunit [Desulfosporosinus acidiphilus]AFM42278.1 RND family efflux transporter, MFP subunit [Desulfosporosinus acidiphilus SJ4]
MKFNLSRIKRIKKRTIIIGLLVIAAALGGNYALKHKKVEAPAVTVKNVKTQKVALGSLSTEVDYASKFDPVHEVQVFPKTGGKVSSVNVDIGSKVSSGQVLFTIDASDQQAQLQIQQQALAVAEENLAKTRSNSEQTLEKDQISYNDAQNDYNNTKALYDGGAASKQDLDNAKTKYDNAAIELKGAQNDPAVSAAEAQVEQAKASINAAQIQLDNLTVVSPISGIVSAKDVKVGGMVSSQSGSVTVIDPSSMIAEINVPDVVIGKIKLGQTVPVSINAVKDKKVTGVITTISPNSNAKDNSYLVKVTIDNSQNDLTAGMFIKISLPAESRSNILLVPNEALSIENNVNYLYAVVDGKVKKIAVTVGISDNKNTEVQGNISKDMDVVTEGQSFLNEGEKVNIVNGDSKQ